jgi:hypothetical protein
VEGRLRRPTRDVPRGRRDRGPPRVARAIEIRGTAELHETGGNEINPRFPRFDPHFLRIRPTRIVAWGIEEGGVDGTGFQQNSRDVG